jgi:hypothetical protein
MFLCSNNSKSKKYVVPLEPPDAKGRAVDFDHSGRRKQTRANILIV